MDEIQLSVLKTDEKISSLIPEMTEQEFLDLKTSVDSEGLRQPIDINSDNTILDGRHRVRVCESIGFETIPCVKHDLNESEAIKFVRDTAVERRNLNAAQRENIVNQSIELISDIQERARENKQNAMKEAHKNNPNHKNDSCGSTEPKLSKPSHTAEEVAKLADTSPATVKRLKKLRKENPEGHKKVMEGESSLWKEYNSLPTVKNADSKKLKEKSAETEPKTEPKTEPEPKEDLRNFINNMDADISPEQKMMDNAEITAKNIIRDAEDLITTIQDIEHKDQVLRILSTMDYQKVFEARDDLKQLIKDGGFEQ